MNSYQIIFTVINQITVFKETVEADNAEQAEQTVRQMIKDAGLTLNHITAVIQL